MSKCRECKGEGRIKVPSRLGESRSVTCVLCKGTGQSRTRKCAKCGGVGYSESRRGPIPCIWCKGRGYVGVIEDQD